MSNAYSVVKSVVVTETTTAQMENEGKYTFKVADNANKVEIAKAIEELFNVKVAAVNTLNYLGKRKRNRGVRMGKRSDFKKAIVTLEKDNKIEIY